MSTSLVAGAAGFLGSNLSLELLRRGHTVVGLDNFCTSSRHNLQNLLNQEKFSFFEGSVSSIESWPKFENLDYIFHLASPASPPKYQKLALETIKANTLGTENLMNVALEYGARFLFASTSEVYGDPEVTPQSEKYLGNVNPIGPRSVYDESKRLGETLVSYFTRELGLNGSIIRIFNTYGPGMDAFDGRVVSSFIRQGLESQEFTVYGDGSQTRSFCFVDDLIAGIIKMAESRERGPINLGNPNEIDLITLGKNVAEALGIKAKFEYHELPEDDPKQRRPDITLAREKLGWEPSVSLSEGLARTAIWMKTTKKD
jgi:nucleoside-diphosphate-sugar epimerase